MFFWNNEKVLREVMVTPHCEGTKCYCIVHFKMVSCLLWLSPNTKREKKTNEEALMYWHRKIAKIKLSEKSCGVHWVEKNLEICTYFTWCVKHMKLVILVASTDQSLSPQVTWGQGSKLFFYRSLSIFEFWTM